MSTLRTCLAVAVPLGLALTVLPASPAAASDDEVLRHGTCTGAADVKIKAKHRDGRLEVEGEVDQNRRGQTWRWTITDNGVRVASGTSTTAGPSGSFSVERKVANRAGRDTLRFRAVHAGSGQVCRAKLTI